MTADDLGPDAIAGALRGSFGRELRVHAAVGSTNDEALEWAAGGAPEGAVVTADQQTKGRGRWSRSWHSPPGRSISLSIVLRPGCAAQTALVTTALGVAVAEALETAAGVECRVKWPNDVLAGGKKVAGILVETRSGSAGIEAVVAGVGINVAWGPEEMPAELREGATSLVAAGAGPPPRSAIVAEVVDAVERWYRKTATDEGRAQVVAAAAARSAVLGHMVLLRHADGRLVEGRAAALLEDGSLQVEVGGDLVAVAAGEVERIRTEG